MTPDHQALIERERPLFEAWATTYRAFVGAFDTPLSRRRQTDEYAEDARIRMRAFDELFRASQDRSAELLARATTAEAALAEAEAKIGRLDAENARLRKEASRDWSAAWHLGPSAAAGHADLLDYIANEIDCGDRCEHGFTEHDTGAFVCRKNDDGECAFNNAALLREIAVAFRHVRARTALKEPDHG